MNFDLVTGLALDREDEQQLRRLLHLCFPKFFEQSIYAKQLVPYRFLVRDGSELIGHCGLEHRVIAVDGQPRRIVGLVDVCVHPERRGRGIGRRLLDFAEEHAKTNAVDDLLLFADDHRLYEQAGFVNVNATCRWLGIDEHRSIGILENDLNDCLMLESLNDAPVEITEIDLLGWLF